MSYLKKFFGHLGTVLTHKHWVFYYASHLGYPLRGLFHDMSKFLPVEFFESVKYWTGKRSPILAAKEQAGISYAWLHHRGRNKHHYDYWIDELNDGGLPRKMPFKYVIEMVCDWLSACRTYTGNSDGVFEREYKWWKSKGADMKMHKDTKKLVHKILWNLAEYCRYYKGDERKTLRTVAEAVPYWERLYNGEIYDYDEER